MKIMALDLGDKWVGSAISDALGITCRPYKTVEFGRLHDFLRTTLSEESIATVVVGLPTTISGGQSEQTEKIKNMKEELEQAFGEVAYRKINWILWDERLSSKRAEQLKGSGKSKEEKQKSHSVAAAFILQSYLDKLAFDKSTNWDM